MLMTTLEIILLVVVVVLVGIVSFIWLAAYSIGKLFDDTLLGASNAFWPGISQIEKQKRAREKAERKQRRRERLWKLARFFRLRKMLQ